MAVCNKPAITFVLLIAGFAINPALLLDSLNSTSEKCAVNPWVFGVGCWTAAIKSQQHFNSNNDIKMIVPFGCIKNSSTVANFTDCFHQFEAVLSFSSSISSSPTKVGQIYQTTGSHFQQHQICSSLSVYGQCVRRVLEQQGPNNCSAFDRDLVVTLLRRRLEAVELGLKEPVSCAEKLHASHIFVYCFDQQCLFSVFSLATIFFIGFYLACLFTLYYLITKDEQENRSKKEKEEEEKDNEGTKKRSRRQHLPPSNQW